LIEAKLRVTVAEDFPLLVSQAKEDKHFLSRLISYAEDLKK
jgi:hypothetical protein